MPAKPTKFGRDRHKWLHSRTAWPALIISIVSMYMGSIPFNNKRVETKSHYVNMRVFSIVFSSMFHHYTVVWYENGGASPSETLFLCSWTILEFHEQYQNCSTFSLRILVLNKFLNSTYELLKNCSQTQKFLKMLLKCSWNK